MFILLSMNKFVFSNQGDNIYEIECEMKRMITNKNSIIIVKYVKKKILTSDPTEY